MIPARFNPIGRWKDSDILAYGVLYDPSNPSPVCQRIVMNGRGAVSTVSSFSNFFAHNFRRCVMDNLSTRHINYYLDAADSTKKADGTAADLTGADGDVMVEIPITYSRITLRDMDLKFEYLVSSHFFDGAKIHPFFNVGPGGNVARKQYVGAYQSTICNAAGERLNTDETASASASFAAGYKARSVAGAKPWTKMTRATHRTAAENNGARGINSLFKQYLLMMMVVEGGTFNTQAGISVGFTKSTSGTYPNTRLSGRCNYGNGTGDLLADPVQDASITWQSGTAANQKVVQSQYRGIENPYGQIFEFEDGFVSVDSGYYWTADDSKYSDTNYETDYALKAHTWPAEAGWVSSWDKESFFPVALGGSDSTYLTDYFYGSAGIHGIFRGGNASNSTMAGAGYIDVSAGRAYTAQSIGSRIAC